RTLSKKSSRARRQKGTGILRPQAARDIEAPGLHTVRYHGIGLLLHPPGKGRRQGKGGLGRAGRGQHPVGVLDDALPPKGTGPWLESQESLPDLHRHGPEYEKKI